MSGPLPLLTLPDFEALVLDRLALCCAEIMASTERVFRHPPGNAMPPDRFPFCYPLVGAMIDPLPLETNGAGSVTVARSYAIRLLGSPVANSMDASAQQGNQGFIDLEPYFNRFRQYFIGHPKLETTTLGSLRYMTGQLSYIESGTVVRFAPGGIEHYAIEPGLTITMKAQVSTLA
jgi:hypothetical protein